MDNEKQSQALWGSIANYKTPQQVLQACPLCVRSDQKSMQKGDEGATRRKRHEEEGVKCCLTAGPLTGCACPPDFHSLIRITVSDKKIQYKGLVMESWGLLHAAGDCHSETLSPPALHPLS